MRSDVADGRLQPFQLVTYVRQKALARFGQRQIARRALKEPNPQVLLKHAHVAADRGRR